MASDVDIVNAALLKLGARPILAFTDDTPEGRLATRRYATVRDDALRAHPWNFAMKRTSLAASSTAPDWGFTYAYPVPTDFLRLHGVYDTGSNLWMGLRDVGYQPDFTPWRIESTTDGAVIATDIIPPLQIRYVAQVTDANLMSPSFREALAAKLAAEWAEAITGSDRKVELMENLSTRKVAEARSVDGQEQTTDDAFHPTVWLTARY